MVTNESFWEVEELSRKSWAKSLMFSPLILRVILPRNVRKKTNSLISKYLAEKPESFSQEFQTKFRFSWRCSIPEMLKCTFKAAYFIGINLEIDKEIEHVPAWIVKIARAKDPNHYLLHKLDANRASSPTLNSVNWCNSLNTEPIQLTNVLLSGAGLIIDENKDLIIFDPGVSDLSPFIAGLWDKLVFCNDSKNAKILGKLAKGTVLTKIEKGIDLTGRCAGNYWHSLIEYLPRIFTVGVDDSWPIIISESTPETIRQALALVAPKRMVIAIGDTDWVNVAQLIVPPFHSSTIDSGRVSATSMFYVDPDYLQSFRHRILEIASTANNVPKKVYLKRESNFRRPQNARKLEDVLKENDFVTLDPVQLTFLEQVQIFQNAECIVTFGGAAWANLIFGNMKSNYISLTTQASAAFDMHQKIAEMMGLNYSQIISTAVTGAKEANPYYRFFCHHSVIVTDEMIHKIKDLIY